MMIRKLTLFLVMTMMVFSLAACGGSNSGKSSHKTDKEQKAKVSQPAAPKTKGLVDDGKTVAVVNGEKVKGKEYNPILKQIQQVNLMAQARQKGKQKMSKAEVYKKSKQQALDSLIGQTLVIQDADKKGYKPSQNKVDNKLADLQKQYGGEKKFKKALSQQKMTVDQLKKNIALQMEWKTYVDHEIGNLKVTDKEIQTYYEQYKASAKKPQKLSKVKPQIEAQLKQQKQQQAIAKIVDQLKKKSKIDIKI
ncbi:MAG TPA: SurA N-terminal domain-containing protein [Bacillales bacterium]|nr:SurA N-terminal domain-containing protein [Bacillales bacterium]